MKKILLILVGGTICCEQTPDGSLDIGNNADIALINGFNNSDSPYKNKVQFTVSENLYILSENLNIESLNKIINTYKKYSKTDNFDGIIFAHGTDTLGFSAAIFAQILKGVNKPVFFVSAQKPLNQPDSNGHDNFRCAVECISRSVTPNIWVAYKNITDGKMYLHLAARLNQCPNYSDDFSSYGAIDITDLTEQNYADYFNKIATRYPYVKTDLILEQYPDFQLKQNILLIDSYVGINYSVYNYSMFSAVLHTTYHSGTAPAKADQEQDCIVHLLKTCDRENIDVYLSPAKNVKDTYQSVVDIANHKNTNFLYGFTKETAYAKLLVAYSLFDEKEKIKQFITTISNTERVD